MLYNQPTGGAANDSYEGKNVASGRQGSKVPPGAVEFPQREIVAAIVDSGQVPTNSDLGQLPKAIRSGKLNYFHDVGGPDALIVAPARPYDDLSEGTEIAVRKGTAANATTTPTLAVSGITMTLVKQNGSALAIGDLPGDVVFEARSDGTRLRVKGARKSDQLTTTDITTTVATYVTNNYAKGSLIARRVFSTPGSILYVRTPGTNRVRPTVKGAGGMGGPTPAVSGGQFYAAGGGGEGGIAVSDITSGFDNVLITVGAGSTTPGVAGGTSSFGSFLSATGGTSNTYGAAGTTAQTQTGAFGGTGSGGNVYNGNGASGGLGIALAASNLVSGTGADSEFGAGGNSVFTSNSPGLDASGYGAGGGGACANNNSPALPGGKGYVGVVIVEEYA